MKSNPKAVATRLVGARATVVLSQAFRWWKGFALSPRRIGISQSNESEVLDRLLANISVPRTFCEFGFDIAEFNCGQLARLVWDGLLIDGDSQRVAIARRVLARDPGLKVTAVNAFLNVDNVDSVIASHFGDRALGVLSVDDGNDYWLLAKLLPQKPGMVVVEYNASFGLRPITVPYDALFERHAKHPSGWYHGASIVALTSLCLRHGYSLVAVSDGGLNVFFVRNELRPPGMMPLAPAAAYRENTLRNHWSKTTADAQWRAVSDLPYVEV